MPYVLASLKLACNYDVNTVVFSHDMIGYASQLFDGSDRGEKLTQLAKAAHAEKLKAWIWVREFQNVPERFMANGVVQLDRPGFWEWLASRYDELFAKYTEFDGLMLTFDETPYRVFDTTKVESSLSMPDRFARVMTTIDAVAVRYHKDFIVRSFVYEPEEMAWFKEGYAKAGPHVMVQTKCEPHDWDPFYPDDPLIGAFPGRKQIIEFDGSSEFTGKNRIPYTQPEYFERRWRYDLSRPGVAGYNIRVDHGGYDALHTPNEINIYAMMRFTADPKVTAADIWREWTGKRYGTAAPEVVKALRPSFDIVNQSFFALQFWITNHSAVPRFSYADEHVRIRTMAKWYPGEPKYKELEDRLITPDPKLLEAILSEKDAAIAMAHRSLQYLQNAKPQLRPEQYDDLYWRLALMERTAIVWKLHAEAFFGYKVLAAGHPVPGLVERVKRALEALKAQAQVSRENPLIGNDPPASAHEIQGFVADLEARLAKLGSP
ncbi:MAG: hypothetical protein ABSH44_19660 [Bryobacteraceae bacterium]|jgi:hypothetical protein